MLIIPENYLTRKSPVSRFQVLIFIFDLLMATESERCDDVPFLNPVLCLHFKAFDVKLNDTVGFLRQKRSRNMYFLLKKKLIQEKAF